MESDPRVTVVVLTLNGEAFVRQQLESIVNQSLRPAEVIVADDGSTDTTLAIVVEVAEATEVPVRVLPPEHGKTPLGTTGNVARALREVRTSMVALADQDDVWMPDRLRSGAGALAPGIDVAGSDALLVDEALRPLKGGVFARLGVAEDVSRAMADEHPDALLRLCLRGNFLPGMTLTMRTEFAVGSLPIPQGWVHDYWWVLRAANRSSLAVIPSPMVRYRQHGRNQVGVPTPLARARSLLSEVRSPAGGEDRPPPRADWSALDRLAAEAPPHASLLAEKRRFEEQRQVRLSLGELIGDVRDGRYPRLRRRPWVAVLADLRRVAVRAPHRGRTELSSREGSVQSEGEG